MTVASKSMDQVGAVARLTGLFQTVTGFFSTSLVPLFDLFIRLWIAKVFFWSGLTKIRDWENTLFLFELEYQVPILPVPVAAFLGTAFELLCPILLAVGFATRFAALPLLAMALVIQFVLGAANPAFDHVQHYYWMILLVAIVLRGAGPISLDQLIGKRLARA